MSAHSRASDSLNKLRDANIQCTLSHQSTDWLAPSETRSASRSGLRVSAGLVADLELVSNEFALEPAETRPGRRRTAGRVSKGRVIETAVLDNTRTRDVLALDDPKLCDRMASTLGTYTRLENTVQRGNDPLVDFAPTGVMSSKAVEAFKLHPNRLKTLAARGQGYLFFTGLEGGGALPVNYAPMPKLRQDWSEELERKDQTKARGLRLYERFVKGGG